MDPNETLRQIRLLIEQMKLEDGVYRNTFIQHSRDLATAVSDLDDWLSKGGFPPTEWTPDERMRE